MSKTIRIKTTPGGDDKQINIDLNQDFDFIEVLSLKLAQGDLYGKFCADYGAVVGRVIANDGFGVPNAKVSLFIPIDEFDESNSLIKSLYPYKTPTEKNSNGIRYNLLPEEPVDDCHVPVGTFPSKQKVTDSNVMLYIYEKYYKFTTTTNEAGDYMIFGLPLGEQTLHFDIDYSDIGFISLRPYDLIDQGASPDMFPARSKFGSSSNLDSLPQIESVNLPVMVTPFWGDEDNCDVGIGRADVELKRKLIPNAFFFGSIFTDGDANLINKSNRPNKKMGNVDQFETGSGTVEMIYRDIYGNVQHGEELEIDDNGNWASMIPMNLAYVVTAEDGTTIPSSDPSKGIPTESEVRFRIGFTDAGFGIDKSTTGKFLVPNMFGNYNFRSISSNDPSFNDYNSFSPVDGKYGAIFPLENNGTSAADADVSDPGNKLRDFVTMRWKKIYTVRQYIARYQKGGGDENKNFIGVKAVEEPGDNNPFPFNRTDNKTNFLFSIICIIFNILLFVIMIVNSIAQFIAVIMILLSKLGMGSEHAKTDRCCQVKIKNHSDLVGIEVDSSGDPVAGASSAAITGTADGGTNAVKWIRLAPKEGKWDTGDKDDVTNNTIYGDYTCEILKDEDGKNESELWAHADWYFCTGNKEYQITGGLPSGIKVSQKPRTKKSGSNDGWICSSCEEPDNDCPPWLPLIPLRCLEDSDTIDNSGDDTNNSIYPVLFKILKCDNVCRSKKKSSGSACLGATWEDVTGDCLAKFFDCFLGKLAKTFDVLDFQFYNDWVNGSLYAFKFKSKTKIKRRKKKIYSKFSDVNCLSSNTTYQDLKENYEQGEYFQHLHGTFEPEHSKNKCTGNSGSQIQMKKEYYMHEASQNCHNLDDNANDPKNMCYKIIDPTCGDPNQDELLSQMYGGVIREYEDNQYYGAYIENPDAPTNGGGSKISALKWMYDRPKSGNTGNYTYEIDDPKGYMLYPTDITQVGSSVICDIDQSAFIIDKLPRSSYNMEELITKYVCMSCRGPKCISTKTIMLHSQVGVSLEFQDDDSTVLEYDTDLREELAKNFSTFPNYNTPFIYRGATTGDGIYKIVNGNEKTKWGYFDYGDNRHNDFKDNPPLLNMINNQEYMIGEERQTPYYFYFGIKKGRTALDKLRNNYLDGCSDNAIL